MQHSDASEVDGAYAYYDRGKNEIHILNPDALYRRILEHEMIHANRNPIPRMILAIEDSLWIRGFMGGSLVFMGIIILFAAIIAALSLPAMYAAIFFAGSIIVTPVVVVTNRGLDFLEEFLVERKAIGETRKPKASEHTIP